LKITRSIITGAAAVFIEKDKLKDDMVYAITLRIYIGDGLA